MSITSRGSSSRAFSSWACADAKEGATAWTCRRYSASTAAGAAIAAVVAGRAPFLMAASGSLLGARHLPRGLDLAGGSGLRRIEIEFDLDTVGILTEELP